MAEVEVNLNRKGVAELLHSPEIQRELNRVAERIAEVARATAPVSHEEHPHYKDHIETREHPTPNRARAEVVASVEHATLVEIRHRTMGKAADAARTI